MINFVFWGSLASVSIVTVDIHLGVAADVGLEWIRGGGDHPGEDDDWRIRRPPNRARESFAEFWFFGKIAKTTKLLILYPLFVFLEFRPHVYSYCT